MVSIKDLLELFFNTAKQVVRSPVLPKIMTPATFTTEWLWQWVAEMDYLANKAVFANRCIELR